MPEQGYPLIDIYDSEVLKAEKVIAALQQSCMKAANLEAFRQEILGRFAEIGLVVVVKVWTTLEDGTFAFDIDICGRTEPVHWDPDKMVHEVRTDILDLLPQSEKGQWIKTGPTGEPTKHKH